MIKILIADDHPLLRQRMKLLIEKSSDIMVAGEAEGGAEVLKKVTGGNFDVVLLDISMPGKNGLEILQDLKARRPDLPVIMLSIYAEEEYVIRAMKSGADGYVAKADAAEELIEAISKVSMGKTFLSSSLDCVLSVYHETGGKGHPYEALFPTSYAKLCI